MFNALALPSSMPVAYVKAIHGFDLPAAGYFARLIKPPDNYQRCTWYFARLIKSPDNSTHNTNVAGQIIGGIYRDNLANKHV